MDRKLIEHLIDAAVNDHAAAAALLEQHPELCGARYIHDETPLHFCAAEGSVEGVRFFAKAGFPVDAVNEFGDTALIDAVTLGNLEVARALLEFGANPDATSPTRDQVLHLAVSKGDPELVTALLAAGAHSDYVTSLDETIWDAVPKRSPQREELLAVLARQGISPTK